jgi:hypothetical protein
MAAGAWARPSGFDKKAPSNAKSVDFASGRGTDSLLRPCCSLVVLRRWSVVLKVVWAWMAGGEWATREGTARLQLPSPAAVVASAGVSMNKVMVVWKWAKAWPPASNPGLHSQTAQSGGVDDGGFGTPP